MYDNVSVSRVVDSNVSRMLSRARKAEYEPEMKDGRFQLSRG